ncbi:MAG: hypothetical protein FWG72_00440 [Oscillospiraceae bacterium]|nr:hypothetical protein [Oscillospiraceae bacterium]
MKKLLRIISLFITLALCTGSLALPAVADGETSSAHRLIILNTTQSDYTFYQGAATEDVLTGVNLIIVYEIEKDGEWIPGSVDSGSNVVVSVETKNGSTDLDGLILVNGRIRTASSDWPTKTLLDSLSPDVYTIHINDTRPESSGTATFTITVKEPVDIEAELSGIALKLQPAPTSEPWTQDSAMTVIENKAADIQNQLLENYDIGSGITITVEESDPAAFDAGDPDKTEHGSIKVEVTITRAPPAGANLNKSETYEIPLRYIWSGVVPHNNEANKEIVTLNLHTETFTPGAFTVAGYAVDDKWKAGSPDAAAIARLINKGGVLKITDKYNARRPKGPADGAVTITFEKIEKRGKTDKLVPNYVIGADNTAGTPGKWHATAKEDALSSDISDVPFENMEIALPADGKKLAATDKWETYDEGNVKNVEPLKADGKPFRTTYFFRVCAHVESGKYIPSAKPVKVNALSQQKTPNAKPDYKRLAVRLKEGQAFNLTAENSNWEPFNANSLSSGSFESNLNTSGSAPVRVFTMAGKKPASAVQTIQIASQWEFVAVPQGLVVQNKVPKDYAIREDGKVKNVKLDKKIRPTVIDGIFIRSTAKHTKDGPTGSTESESGVLALVWENRNPASRSGKWEVVGSSLFIGPYEDNKTDIENWRAAILADTAPDLGAAPEDEYGHDEYEYEPDEYENDEYAKEEDALPPEDDPPIEEDDE